MKNRTGELKRDMWALIKPCVKDVPWKPEVVFVLTNDILTACKEKGMMFAISSGIYKEGKLYCEVEEIDIEKNTD